MQHLHHTPPRRSTRRAAIHANARLTAMLTPARGRRSTAGVSSAAKQLDFAASEENVSNVESRDEESLSSAESSETDEIECCICLEEPSADDVATIDGCEHKFCVDCVTQWSETNNVCPLCRTRFTSIESAGGVLQQVPDRRPGVAAGIINLVRVFNLEEVADGGGNEDLDDVFATLRQRYVASTTAVSQQQMEAHQQQMQVLRQQSAELQQQAAEIQEQTRTRIQESSTRGMWNELDPERAAERIVVRPITLQGMVQRRAERAAEHAEANAELNQMLDNLRFG
eukprot:scaffold7489_cov203-Skeletonema_dohrnii-CCMP3373.AAC.2